MVPDRQRVHDNQWRMPPSEPPDPTVTVRPATPEERQRYGLDEPKEEQIPMKPAIEETTIAAIRQAWHAGHTLAQIVQTCHVSPSTAYKYTRGVARHPLAEDTRAAEADPVAEATSEEAEEAVEPLNAIADAWPEAADAAPAIDSAPITENGPKPGTGPIIIPPMPKTKLMEWIERHSTAEDAAKADLWRTTGCRVVDAATDPAPLTGSLPPEPHLLDTLAEEVWSERDRLDQRLRALRAECEAIEDALEQQSTRIDAVEITRELLGLPRWATIIQERRDRAWAAAKAGDATALETLSGLRKIAEDPAMSADREADDGD